MWRILNRLKFSIEILNAYVGYHSKTWNTAEQNEKKENLKTKLYFFLKKKTNYFGVLKS